MNRYFIEPIKTGGYAVFESQGIEFHPELIAVGDDAKGACVKAFDIKRDDCPDSPALGDILNKALTVADARDLAKDLVNCSDPGYERKIHMIKLLRRLSGFGLKEAKDMIEDAIGARDRSASRW